MDALWDDVDMHKSELIHSVFVFLKMNKGSEMESLIPFECVY